MAACSIYNKAVCYYKTWYKSLLLKIEWFMLNRHDVVIYSISPVLHLETWNVLNSETKGFLTCMAVQHYWIHVAHTQRANNVYTTLVLGHIYVLYERHIWTFTKRCYDVCKWTLFWIRLSNVYKTLSKNFEIFYYLNVAETLHIRLYI